jgi:lipopolysaccharide/colanic/teichoic acid biosynthesis glycosyltransferase
VSPELVVAGCAAGIGTLVIGARQARAPVANERSGEARVLFVGETASARRLIAELEAPDRVAAWRVLGLVADLAGMHGPRIGPWLGTLADLPEIIASTAPTHIVLAPAVRRARAAEQVLFDAYLAGIVIEDALSMSERVTGKLPIERLTAQSLLRRRGFQHADVAAVGFTHHAARAVSGVLAAVGLLCGAPLFALIALAIRLDSRGPVFFVQERLGMGGRPFRLYKFRTMREGRVRSSEWVSDNADRITAVGRWLRRFRLDEWPQLVNVLMGDMNLVGPRPHPSCNAPLFLARIPHYRLRFSVRPGITGWAQIRYGYANGLEEETEKMRYDLYYIKHRSLIFDLRILVLTVWTLLFDRHNHESAHHSASAVWTPRWDGRREGLAR